MAIYYKNMDGHFPVEVYLKKYEKYSDYCLLYRELESIISKDKQLNICVYSTKNRIAWSRNKVFAEFHVCSEKLVIHTTKPLNFKPEIGHHIPITHKWSKPLNWKIEYSNIKDLTKVMEILNQAYELA